MKWKCSKSSKQGFEMVFKGVFYLISKMVQSRQFSFVKDKGNLTVLEANSWPP